MKAVIEIETQNLEKGDFLVFDGNSFIPISKNAIMSEIWAKIKELENTIDTNKQEVENFKDGVNSKLEEHHKVLQILTKGE